MCGSKIFQFVIVISVVTIAMAIIVGVSNLWCIDRCLGLIKLRDTNHTPPIPPKTVSEQPEIKIKFCNQVLFGFNASVWVPKTKLQKLDRKFRFGTTRKLNQTKMLCLGSLYQSGKQTKDCIEATVNRN